MIILLDNYDSFTYNIFQALSRITSDEVRVLRNDAVTVEALQEMDITHLVISPGPGRPEQAGISIDAIRTFAGKIPILGVCLGMQAIAAAFGAQIIGAKRICHGVAEKITLDEKGLFRTLGEREVFTRYHSLVVDESTLSPDFTVTARADDGDIMGIRHNMYVLEGVQFHPESIASSQGEAVFKAFLSYRRERFPFKTVLANITEGKSMSKHLAELFMEDLTDGVLDERQTTAILTALTAKGPAAEEIAGCAAVLGRKKIPVPISGKLTDIVGTGGDAKGSFNISSMAALVAAACGIAIAKHGNRAVSSLSGSADFYEELGFVIDLPAERTAEIIRQTNFGFLYAPVYHRAMRFAAPVRKVLGMKTIMNLVGPLSNPAGATHQLLGVYEKRLMEPVALAAHLLGAHHVMVVCSQDGYDEISPSAPTDVLEIDRKGNRHFFVIHPSDYGFSFSADQSVRGGDSKENVRIAQTMLTGDATDIYSAAVLLNTGAALLVSEAVSDLGQGIIMARKALLEGTVSQKIEQIRQATHA
jgi:anthranilate synthase/phosphoribosyltransferase